MLELQPNRVAHLSKGLGLRSAQSGSEHKNIKGTNRRSILPPLRLDHVPDFRRDMRPAEPRDGADAGKTIIRARTAQISCSRDSKNDCQRRAERYLYRYL
jgi:hypothetical protein